MRSCAVLVASMFLFGVAAGQWSVEQFRFDIGYGGAPPTSPYFGMRFMGTQVVVTADMGGADFSLFYTKRVSSGSNSTEATTTLISLHVGPSWEHGTSRFSISGGIGAFSIESTTRSWSWIPTYPYYSSRVENVKIHRVALSLDARMCWNFLRSIGLGASIYGAQVKDNSYLGFSVFLRFST